MTPDEIKAQAEPVLRGRRASFRIFVEHEQGKECLEHIEFLGYVHRSAIVLDADNRVDPYILAFREGRRSLAIEIRNHVQALGQPAPQQERAVSALAEG